MNYLDIAYRYAKALFLLDSKKETLCNRLQALESLKKNLEQYPKLMPLLTAPVVDNSIKEKMLGLVFADKKDPELMRFLILLIEKKRFFLLAFITDEFRQMVNQAIGVWEADMITAVKVNEDIKGALKDKLKNIYHKDIQIKDEVNQKMIGGAFFMLSNQMIDGSVKGRLRKLKEQLLEKST